MLVELMSAFVEQDLWENDVKMADLLKECVLYDQVLTLRSLSLCLQVF